MFSDVETITIMQCDRAVARTVADAQGIVDRKNRQIGALQQELAATKRALAAARAEIEQMRAERGMAGMTEFRRVRALRNARAH